MSSQLREGKVFSPTDPSMELRPSVLMALLGSDVAAAASSAKLVPDGQFVEEQIHVQHAIPARRAEFATGRACARRALSQLGLGPLALPPGPTRAPLWPGGVVGSISHSRGICAAAAAWTVDIVALGLDLEPDQPLPPRLESLICTDVEIAWLDQVPARERARLARLIFSAKEALYKCQHPHLGLDLEFLDLSLKIDLQAQVFSVRPADLTSARVGLGEILGQFRRDSGLIISCAIIRNTRTRADEP